MPIWISYLGNQILLSGSSLGNVFYNSAALPYMYSKYCIWKTNTWTVSCLQHKMSAPSDFPMTAKSQTTRRLRPTRRIPTRPSVLLDWRRLSRPPRLLLTPRPSPVLYRGRGTNFFRGSPFRSVTFQASELALLRNSEWHGMSTFFSRITENVPSLFRGIFSERNSVPNSSRIYFV